MKVNHQGFSTKKELVLVWCQCSIDSFKEQVAFPLTQVLVSAASQLHLKHYNISVYTHMGRRKWEVGELLIMEEFIVTLKVLLLYFHTFFNFQRCAHNMFLVHHQRFITGCRERQLHLQRNVNMQYPCKVTMWAEDRGVLRRQALVLAQQGVGTRLNQVFELMLGSICIRKTEIPTSK